MEKGVVLPREFYARPTVDVAQGLLGKVLVHGTWAGRIVETEAYLAEGDAAAHSAAGLTPRTRVIFGPPGHAYIYLNYGIHHCLNIVAEPEGIAGCVLIRALEPVGALPHTSNGPGKLTRAMGIDLRHYGADLTNGPLTVRAAPELRRSDILVTPRIGITKAAGLPLRYLIAGNAFVSRRR
ncbi:MAG: DNA-3-methyladenine glycosylase [Bryobacteraceae bacterium]